jgi:hypothetical protein
MALHRDIFWVGRQWAVTGYGIQACNQKQKGKFDIEGARLWDDGVLESLRDEKWLNVADFEKAIEVARKYYPQPPRKAVPLKASVAGPIETASKEPALIEPGPKQNPVAAPEPAVREFNMRIVGWPAKFQPLWRIRSNRR